MDKFFVNKLDALMNWAQKNHGINLATTKLCSWVMVFILSVMQGVIESKPIWAGFSFLFWSIIVGMEYSQWKDNRSYFENYRKTLHLNAVAVMMREQCLFVRNFGIFMTVAFAITLLQSMYANTWTIGVVVGDIAWLNVLFATYLGTSFYIGPGEFAREKQEVMHKDLVGSKF
jgi:hypothetical protein